MTLCAGVAITEQRWKMSFWYTHVLVSWRDELTTVEFNTSRIDSQQRKVGDVWQSFCYIALLVCLFVGDTVLLKIASRRGVHTALG